jgi:predicted heme/steroid binding protein
MDEFEMRSRISGYLKEVCHYSQMQVFATSYYQKNYFQMQIDDAAEGLVSLYMDLQELPRTRRRPLNDRLPEEYEQSINYEQFFTEPEAVPEDGEPSDEEDLGLQEPRIFTPEELAYYDGKDGRPAYVAVNGIVYDVSSVALWAGGNHFGQSAGRDLSNAFMNCHQGIMDRLNRLPKVGILDK